MENNKTTFRNIDKRTLIAFIALCVITVFILFIPFIINRNQTSTNVVDDGNGEDTIPYTSFENRYQLNYSIGQTPSARIFYDLGEIITREGIVAVLPEPTAGEVDIDNLTLSTKTPSFTATLVENTFRKIPDSVGLHFMFNLDVSDGRTYTVYVYADDNYGAYYYYSLLCRADAATATLTVDITKLGAEKYSIDIIADAASDWARVLLPNNTITLTVNELNQ